MNAAEQVTFRGVQLGDAEAVAELSAELGYPVTAEIMEARIRYVLGRDDHAVLVACFDQRVAGWIEVGIAHHLQSSVYAEIGGLVVSSSVRSRGIGRELVAAAEQWANDHGITEMLVRSQVMREAAHRFYLREGYSRIKTSAVFSKRL